MKNFNCKYCDFEGDRHESYPDFLFCPDCHKNQNDENDVTQKPVTVTMKFDGISDVFGGFK
jgi:hypothetical protein